MKRQIGFKQNEANVKVFKQLYEQKFINHSMVDLSQKRQIVASQMRPSSKQSQDSEEIVKNTSSKQQKYFDKRSQSVGSLLPKLKQLEKIQKIDKKISNKQSREGKKINKMLKTKPMSSLDVYLSNLNTDRQQQNSLIFLTANNKSLSDQQTNAIFQKFVNVQQMENTKKNLRAVLNLASSLNLTSQQKQFLLTRRKEEIQKVAKQILEDQFKKDEESKNIGHNTKNQKNTTESVDSQANVMIDREIDGEEESQAFQTKSFTNYNEEHKKQKDIKWVIHECKKYDNKFSIKKRNKGFQKK